MENTRIVNPWVVVDYSGGRPPHIYKIVEEFGNFNNVICSDRDDKTFELEECYKRFSMISDAVKDVAKGNGHSVGDFVGEYSLLFHDEKDNLAKLL